MSRRKIKASEAGGGLAAMTDLMAVLSFAFLLLLGVAILSAGTMLLVARSQTISVRIAQYELQMLQDELRELEAAKAVQEVADRSRAALLETLVAQRGAQSVFLRDDEGAGVKLDADILFELGDSRLRNTTEVNELLANARGRLCEALERYQETFEPPEGMDRSMLRNPIEYLEVSFEGHADRTFGRGSNNWRLSSNRATSLLESFVVPERDAEPPDPSRVCRPSTDGSPPRIESRVVRVFAAGRGAMDAGNCGEQRQCAEDRYALLRITVRMDRVLQDVENAFATAENGVSGEGTIDD